MRDSDVGKANDALREVAKLRDQVRTLERRADKQAALIRALSELVFEKTGLTDAELLAAIARIEQKRVSEATTECPQCDRALKTNSRKCLYCGHEIPVGSVFDII